MLLLLALATVTLHEDFTLVLTALSVKLVGAVTTVLFHVTTELHQQILETVCVIMDTLVKVATSPVHLIQSLANSVVVMALVSMALNSQLAFALVI